MRARLIVIGAIVGAFAILFGLQRVNHYRDQILRREAQAQEDVRYRQVRKDLRARMPSTVALFSSEMKTYVAGASVQSASDMEVARLLRAFGASTPHEPIASILVPAQAPYRYCIINPGSPGRCP